MKFKAQKLEIKKLLDGNTEIVLEVEDKQDTVSTQIKSLVRDELEVDITKWRKRRSLNHNRLFWDMCNHLTESINDPLITANSIYKNLIMEYGVSTIYPVEDSKLDMIIKDWENRGEGWITSKLRKSNLDGNYTNVKFWFGSSIYDSKMFWKLIEGLKQMCRDNDVDISMYDKQLQETMKAFEEREKAMANNKEKQ